MKHAFPQAPSDDRQEQEPAHGNKDTQHSVRPVGSAVRSGTACRRSCRGRNQWHTQSCVSSLSVRDASELQRWSFQGECRARTEGSLLCDFCVPSCVARGAHHQPPPQFHMGPAVDSVSVQTPSGSGIQRSVGTASPPQALILLPQ